MSPIKLLFNVFSPSTEPVTMTNFLFLIVRYYTTKIYQRHVIHIPFLLSVLPRFFSGLSSHFSLYRLLLFAVFCVLLITKSSFYVNLWFFSCYLSLHFIVLSLLLFLLLLIKRLIKPKIFISKQKRSEITYNGTLLDPHFPFNLFP